MNKAIVSILIASGLMLLEIPEAAAHPEFRSAHRAPIQVYSDGYHRDHRHPAAGRTSRMPHWLKEDRSFRHWYKHTRLQRNPYLSWHELFNIYCWEYSSHHRRRGHRHH